MVVGVAVSIHAGGKTTTGGMRIGGCPGWRYILGVDERRNTSASGRRGCPSASRPATRLMNRRVHWRGRIFEERFQGCCRPSSSSNWRNDCGRRSAPSVAWAKISLGDLHSFPGQVDRTMVGVREQKKGEIR